MFATLNIKTMTNNKSSQFDTELQELAELFGVLSHPARIAIIKLIAEKKEIRTGNIHEFLPVSRSTVSQHLKELRNAGIIKGTIDGLKIHYCLDIDRIKELKDRFNSLFDYCISDFMCEC